MGTWTTWGCWAILGISLVGCNRQDTESLARIGKKIAVRSQSVVGNVRERFDLNFKTAAKEPTLQDKVAQRLKLDAKLANTTIDVTGQGNDVLIKGKVQSQDQRDRAADLAQNTVGVERVQVELELPPPPPPPPDLEPKQENNQEKE